ncbi:hypothetical protein Thiosp_01973 [Thiorhodovibrio litoralis]|nr:hypothetical protein Thiosp_01973 [Thiorhodovibrio litoralis]
MAIQERDCNGKAKGVTPAQRLLLSAIQANRDPDSGLAEVSLSALQGMTDLSRRGITKALSGLDGHAIERISGGPGRQNQYRILDEGAACLAQPVAINGSASQAFNPASLPPTPTMWPPAAQSTAVSPQLQRQPEGFSVNPLASQPLDDRRPFDQSHAVAKPASTQPTARQPEPTPFGQSVGLPITPDSISALLTQPVVWQQIKQLAETILAIQPDMDRGSPATPINPSPTVSEMVSGSPPNQRQLASVPVAQSAGQAESPANTVSMSASPTQPASESLPTHRQAASASVVPSANPAGSPASPVTGNASAGQKVVAKQASPHQAEPDSRRPQATPAMSPTNPSVRPASPPTPASTADRMNNSPSRSEPTARPTSQRPPQPAPVGQGVSATINPNPGVPESASANRPTASTSPPF